MAGNEFLISQLSQWHSDNYQGGMDLEAIARNTVVRINQTNKLAKERGQTLLWCRQGPIDLRDPNLGVSKEMWDAYVLTNDLKNEKGLMAGSEYDRLLMKTPLNSGESIMSVNTNVDLMKYMSDAFLVPALLKDRFVMYPVLFVILCHFMCNLYA